MNTAEFAKLKGCTRRSVLRAIETGAIPAAAVRRRGKGRHRSVDIINPDLAARVWEPAARFSADSRTAQPGAAVDTPDEKMGIAEARERFEAARAKREELRLAVETGQFVERAAVVAEVGGVVLRSRSQFLQLANRARGRIPHLTVDDGIAIDDLVREVLTELAEGTAESLAIKGRKRGRRKQVQAQPQQEVKEP